PASPRTPTRPMEPLSLDLAALHSQPVASRPPLTSPGSPPSPFPLEHTGTEVSETASDDTSLDIDTLSLTLGDSSSVPQAIEYLERSANLYDQIGAGAEAKPGALVALTLCSAIRSPALPAFLLRPGIQHRTALVHGRVPARGDLPQGATSEAM